MIETPFDKVLTGLEIKDWIWYHTHNKTKHTPIAKTMGSFFNLIDSKLYKLVLIDDNIVVEDPEKGIL